MLCDFTFILQPCYRVNLCTKPVFMRTAEPTFVYPFLEAHFVWLGQGIIGHMDASHTPLCFGCVVLRDRATQQEAC